MADDGGDVWRAVAGDGVSYWLGCTYGEALSQMWPLRRRRALIDKGEAFFARHGDKAIFIARFTPGLRAVVPLAAGILKTRPASFYVANVFSAAVWGPTHVGIGVAIGSSIAWLKPGRGEFAGLILGVFVIVCFVAWAMLRLLRRRSQGDGCISQRMSTNHKSTSPVAGR